MNVNFIFYIEKRVELFQKIRAAYPDKIPIIVEKVPGTDVPDIKKKKFLSPPDIALKFFFEEVRQQIDITNNPEEVIDFLLDTPTGVISPSSCMKATNLYFLKYVSCNHTLSPFIKWVYGLFFFRLQF